MTDHPGPELGPDGYDQAAVRELADMLRDSTGHPVTEQLLPAAELLVTATRSDHGPLVDEALAMAEDVTGDRMLGAVGLALLLAAAVDDAHPIVELVEWTSEKPMYRRLRAAGLPHQHAARVIGAMRAGERGQLARELLDADVTPADLAHYQATQRGDDHPTPTPGRRLSVVRADHG